MPYTAKASLMRRFPFLTIQEWDKRLFMEKKKKYIKSYYFQHWEIPSATAQPRQFMDLPLCRTCTDTLQWVSLPLLCSSRQRVPCSATPSPGMLLPSPLPLAATTTSPGHGTGLQEHLGYFCSWLHSLLPRIFLEFVFSVWWENNYFHTSKNWNVFFP